MSFRSLIQELITRNSTVLVLGLGVSGIETAQFLHRIGLKARCIERTPEVEFRAKSKFARRVDEMKSAGVEFRFGVDGERVAEELAGVELCVVSPGVSLESAVVGALRRHGKKIVSELELGIELRSEVTAVVTGSNGKSTTVTLLHEMLSAGGIPTTLCGNIGTPVVTDITPESLQERRSDSANPSAWLVVEASSYQLEACQVLKPKIGVFLNLSDNHLERHGSMERYFAAKAQLFALQDQTDIAILNCDDLYTKRLVQSVSGTVATFGIGAALSQSKHHAQIQFNPRGGQDEVSILIGGVREVVSALGTRLIGLHNRYNIAAAALAARIAGVQSSTIQEVVRTFQPLEHRIEFVRGGADGSGPLVINDSKATTVAAAAAAVQCVRESFPSQRLQLMIGGFAKAGSWDPLLNLLVQHSSSLLPVICFGKDGPLLASHCRERGVPWQIAPSVAGAVEASRTLANGSSDVVQLFSPGCASFDEFSDFEARGRCFKDLVQQ